jgi:hypothetical protein
MFYYNLIMGYTIEYFKGFFIFWTIIILMFIMSNLFFSRLDNL